MEFRYIYNPQQAEYFIKRGVKLDHIYKNCHIFVYDDVCEQAFVEWKSRKLQKI